MTTLVPVAVSPLRQRLIDEMDIRRFGHDTQSNHIRDVGRSARSISTVVGRVFNPRDREDTLGLIVKSRDGTLADEAFG